MLLGQEIDLMQLFLRPGSISLDKGEILASLKIPLVYYLDGLRIRIWSGISFQIVSVAFVYEAV